MLSILRTPSRRRFYLAHLQSQLGTGAAYVALLLVAYHRLHSAWAITLVLLADFIPGMVLSPVCGALADRWPRRRLIIAADLLRAGAFIALAFSSSFAATIGLALVAGIGTAAFNPALSAALPAVVDEDERSPATALYGGICNLGITVGPALAALVSLFAAPELILAINGVTFAVSAMLLSGVPLGTPAVGGEDDDAPRSSLLADTRDGARDIAGLPGMLALLSISGLSVVAGGMINVAEPLMATGPLHAGNSGYSLLVSVFGAASVTLAMVNSRLSSRVAALRLRWIVGLAAYGVALLATALAPSLWVAVLTFALTGAANAVLVGPEIRLVQELVPDRLLGRAFGLRDVGGNVSFVAATLGAGVLASVLGVRVVFAVGGIGCLALAPLARLWFHPAPGAADAGEAAKAAEATPHLATALEPA